MDFVIRNGVLKKYTGKDKNIIIPEGVKEIDRSVFYDNHKIVSVSFPESIKEIGPSAFDGCKNLTSVSVSSVKKWLGIQFYGNPLSNGAELRIGEEAVKRLIIPEGVRSIKDYAFSGCSSITEVVIPEGVRKIGISAFSNCSNLQSVTLPETLEVIENNAFSHCPQLQKINMPHSLLKLGNQFGGTIWQLTSAWPKELNLKSSISGYYSLMIKTMIPPDIIPKVKKASDEEIASVLLYQKGKNLLKWANQNVKNPSNVFSAMLKLKEKDPKAPDAALATFIHTYKTKLPAKVLKKVESDPDLNKTLKTANRIPDFIWPPCTKEETWNGDMEYFYYADYETDLMLVSNDLEKMKAARDVLVCELLRFSFRRIRVAIKDAEEIWYGIRIVSPGFEVPNALCRYHSAKEENWNGVFKTCADLLGDSGVMAAAFTITGANSGRLGYIYTIPNGYKYTRDEAILKSTIFSKYKRVGDRILFALKALQNGYTQDEPEADLIDKEEETGRFLADLDRTNRSVKELEKCKKLDIQKETEELELRINELKQKEVAAHFPQRLEESIHELEILKGIDKYATQTERYKQAVKYVLATPYGSRKMLKYPAVSMNINGFEAVEKGNEIVLRDRIFAGAEYISIKDIDSIRRAFYLYLEDDDLKNIGAMIVRAGGVLAEKQWIECSDYLLVTDKTTPYDYVLQNGFPVKPICFLSLLKALCDASEVPVSERKTGEELIKLKPELTERRKQIDEEHEREMKEKFEKVIDELKQYAAENGSWKTSTGFYHSPVVSRVLAANGIVIPNRKRSDNWILLHNWIDEKHPSQDYYDEYLHECGLISPDHKKKIEHRDES